MKLSDTPARFPIPFANAAASGYIRSIPQAHQTPITGDAPASLTDGFPPETFVPAESGGTPPNGKDFNGILFQITAALRWMQAGGSAVYDNSFVTDIGGYPRGAVLTSASSAGVQWLSLVDDNTVNPDSGPSVNWLEIASLNPTFSISGGNWKRVDPDGFIEMGGVAPITRSTEGAFGFTFPMSAFPTACLGISAMPINSAQSTTGQTTIQEVSLTASGATLFAQNHQSNLQDIAGGMRWRAWGY